VEDEGAIAVPARTLIDLVNALPPDQVEMDGIVRTMTLNLRCGRSEANIKGMDAMEFPPVPVPEGEGGVRLDSEEFSKAISQVAFAAATDEARPILTGVLVDIVEAQMVLAAADGYRLSVRDTTLLEPVSEPLRMIIPARAMAELSRICGDFEDPILATVTPDQNRVLFQMPDVVMVSQLIPGNFPDYEQIIPRGHSTRTVVPTADLLKACRTAHIFAREGAHIVQFHVHAGEELTPGRMVVSATSAETGDDVVEMDASVEGESVDIAFNVKYTIDALLAIDTPQVAIDTTSSSSPGVMRPVGEENFTHVIMPMHLGR
jgi:DNA polymerase-3 subunit beta